MLRRGWLLVVWGVATGSAVAAWAEAELPVDPATGLVMDEQWQVVAAHCGACHSTRLVTQNRGSRETWLRLIRWMQESQGLWPFNEETERVLLDYLEKNYGPVPTARRPALPAELMPPRSERNSADTGRSVPAG